MLGMQMAVKVVCASGCIRVEVGMGHLCANGGLLSTQLW